MARIITSRREFLGALGLAGAAGLLPRASGAGKPNILFFAVDDLKPLLGCYGYDKIHAPNIDRIAARGTSFLNNMCQQAVCGPTRASLMTGLRPDTTKVWDLATKMRDILPDVLTLPQHLKAHGYETTGMGKIFDGRCCDGWLTQDAISWSIPCVSAGGTMYANKAYSSSKPTDKNRDKVERPPVESADVPDDVYTDGATANLAVKTLAELAKGNKPFFLGVGFVKPHLPFCSPKKYWDMYKREDFSIHPFQEHSKQGPELAYHDSGELRSGYTGVPQTGPFPESLQLDMLHGYYAAVSFMDAQVGKVLDELERQGIEDNTIIVLWGDHGWHLGDHGMWCKHSNFEQAGRAPLIIAAPSQRQKGTAATAPSEFVDIFPTLCELTGVPIPEVLQGVSLRPMLDDPSVSVKAAAINQYPRSEGGKPVMGYAYRTERYRYVEWVQKDYRKGETTGPVIARELYDYAKDPMETVNAVDDPEYTEVTRRFERLAKAGWQALPGKTFKDF